MLVLVLLPGSEANDQQILDEALAILSGKSVSNLIFINSLFNNALSERLMCIVQLPLELQFCAVLQIFTSVIL